MDERMDVGMDDGQMGEWVDGWMDECKRDSLCGRMLLSIHRNVWMYTKDTVKDGPLAV